MCAKIRFTNYPTFCETYESIMVIHDKEPEILGILRSHSSAFWIVKTTFTFQEMFTSSVVDSDPPQN